ncbi:hypothetical protein [Serratia marcescens]|uniref:hypothetical protein n=1 Tax=Serratia marcescens TaxID=615 RepID=UPI001F279F32|nr:hypothetical protein [Serratia marcescens]
MANPKKIDKPEEKFIKDGENLTSADAAVGDATNTSTDATAGDATNTSTDATAGDATNAGTDATAGDATNAGTDATAGDATNAGADATAGDAINAGTDATDGDTSSSWFTVQVVRSPSGKRFRAGIEFTSEPKPYDFSLLSDEQIAAISADTFLRIKPIAPTGE